MVDDARQALDALIREHGEDYSALSRLLGRNPAYIQQYIKRGSPRRLSEEDRAQLAAYFRISEERLGGRGGAIAAAPSPPALLPVPRVEIGASAGPGAIAEIEEYGPPIGFDAAMLRGLGVTRTTGLSIIRVTGASMEPTLLDGDDILVDRNAVVLRSGAIYVLRLDDVLIVKRLVSAGAGPLVIRSDNPAFPDIVDYDPATLTVVGRVLWCGRKIG
ncbi:S24 family peptidase [Sphingomonas sp. SRS2]|uniref:S24 family peptidase n=1 Tax=Sphingomonas sp. SRS2 TaxID=133190 RepID=UPI00061847DB|nr:LexA family transcriptional regulator [Sphingomonas sp. SRS2]KKC27451.1 peptidase S24 [Sphingomonas sp. SRS2]